MGHIYSSYVFRDEPTGQTVYRTVVNGTSTTKITMTRQGDNWIGVQKVYPFHNPLAVVTTASIQFPVDLKKALEETTTIEEALAIAERYPAWMLSSNLSEPRDKVAKEFFRPKFAQMSDAQKQRWGQLL